MMYADDAVVAFKSTIDFSKMTVIVTVFESTGLTVSETKKETTLLHPRFSRPHPPARYRCGGPEV